MHIVGSTLLGFLGRVGGMDIRLAAGLVGLGLFALACGGPLERGPGGKLPPYDAHAMELFDDGIEPSAIGFETGVQIEPSRSAPRADNLLRERTQVGDAVVRARVTTVTAKDEDRGRSWQLGLRTEERLAGSGALDADFTLPVDASGPSAGMLRAFENRLVGTVLVAFVRQFARAGGDPELHFHIARDSKDEIDAVRAAVLLNAVK